MATVITGSPGVGKHTVAEHLAKNHDMEILDLNKIAIKNKIIQKSKETFDVDVTELENIVKGEISDESLVVGHLAPYVLVKRQVRIALVLRKSPYELEHIYKKRGYSKDKTLNNQASEILGIITHDAMTRFGRQKTIQIDTTRRLVKETVRDAQNALLSSDRPPNDAVDWLGLVNDKNDLKKFFPTS